MLLRRRQECKPGGRSPGGPRGPVEAVEQTAADLILLQHHRDGVFLIERGAAGTAAIGIGGERLLQFVREAEIVHDETTRLVPKHPVHAGDRLHQPVAAHRLVHVHGVKARRVEPGEPHVPHQHEVQRIIRIAEAPR